MPFERDAVLVTVATIGTTIAPWGLAFIQSYAVDKRLDIEDLRYERIDLVVGSLLTGVIGVFIAVACAVTLHAHGVTINDEPPMPHGRSNRWPGSLASTMFALGFLGAALLAAAIVPLSTAYSVAEALGARADLNDSFAEAPVFYVAYGAVVATAAAVVLIPERR